jgi:hypothetical protein
MFDAWCDIITGKKIDKDGTNMAHDFGAGITVDDLIGMTAYQITHLSLPPGDIFMHTLQAGRTLEENSLDSCILVELWEDGHTVWQSEQSKNPVWVTPNGQIRQIH